MLAEQGGDSRGKRVFVLQDIFVHQRHIPAALNSLSCQRGHVSVNVHGDHVTGYPCQKGGHSPGTSANLQHHILRSRIPMSYDKFDQIHVDQEILTQIPADSVRAGGTVPADAIESDAARPS